MLQTDDRIPWWWRFSKCRTEKRVPNFFVDERNPKQVKTAKAFCQGCPVRLLCLEYSKLTDCQEGVFGGATPDERVFLLAIQPALSDWQDILLASHEEIVALYGDTDIPRLAQLLQQPKPSLELIESSYQDQDQTHQSDSLDPEEIVVLVVVA